MNYNAPLIQVFTRYFPQTLTTLDLQNNQIGDQGAQHLANALQVNKVTTTFLLITSSFTHFSHRHSPHYPFTAIKSETKGHNISPMLSQTTR